MADVQIAIIDQQNTDVTIAVPGIQGIQGQTGDVAVAQDGTQGTPGIRFENDPDTGIYRPGANQLALSTNGTGRLFVSDNGVATGGAPQFGYGGIQVRNSFVYINEDGANTTQMYLRTTSNEAAIQVATNHPFKIQTNNQERLRITSTGELKHLGGGSEGSPAVYFAGSAPSNSLYVEATTGHVGIGTRSPSSLFHAYGSANNSIARVENTDTTNGYGFFVKGGGTTSGRYVASFQDAAGNTRLHILSSGNVGIGTNLPGYLLDLKGTRGNLINTTGVGAISALGDVIGGIVFTPADGSNPTNDATSLTKIEAQNDFNGAWDGNVARNDTRLVFYTSTNASSTAKAVIDSSGRLLVGTSSTSQASTTLLAGNSAGTDHAILRVTTKSSAPASGAPLGSITWGDSGHTTAAAINVLRDGGTWTSGASQPTRLEFSTTADGASSPVARFVIKNDGYIYLQEQGQAEGYNLFGPATQCAFYQMGSANFNAANTGMKIGRNSSTGRSINAGGTVNASGADYAEYMTKAGNFSLAKGGVCGVNAEGKLTNVFAHAISFVVKSTDPSYVGGDIWGTEEAVGAKPDADDVDALAQWEANLEAARQAVDRIAFAGQVPVNVIGATPGQYIVPIESADGGIEGIVKNEADLTLAEYMRAVGKVIAIEDDGRARIIVKVA